MRVQSSELYGKMLSRYALKIRRRMTSLICLLSKMFSSVFRLSIARPILRLISSSVSNKEPSSLLFFSSSCRRFFLFRIFLFWWCLQIDCSLSAFQVLLFRPDSFSIHLFEQTLCHRHILSLLRRYVYPCPLASPKQTMVVFYNPLVGSEVEEV